MPSRRVEIKVRRPTGGDSGAWTPRGLTFAVLGVGLVAALVLVGAGTWRRLTSPSPGSAAALEPGRPPAAVAVAPVSLVRERQGDDKRPNILVVTLCSVRADAVGAYGGERVSTPALDALAAEGVRFADAWTTATYTLPSHAALLTGRLPSAVGVVTPRDTLAAEYTTLPELLKLYGYSTFAYAPVASRASFRAGDGLEQGFDYFEEGFTGRIGPPNLWGPIDEASEPWLLVAHLKEAHRPYNVSLDAASPAVRAWAEGAMASDGSMDPDAALLKAMSNDQDVAKELRTVYDAGVSAADASLGAIVAGARARGLLGRTVVVVVGDHGEALGEHGHAGHQGFLDAEVLGVPLVVRPPGGTGGGGVVLTPVSLLDLFPTIAEWAGAVPPADIQGRSLVGALRGEESRPAVLVAEAERRAPGSAARVDRVLRDGSDWLFRTAGGDRLERDGIEVDDPARMAVLGGLLDARLGAGAPVSAPRPPTAAELEALRREGYW